MNVFAALRNRVIARLARDEQGYIALTSMGIMLLLLGASLTVLGATKAQVLNAREGREFVEARQSMDEAFAVVTDEVNTNTAYRANIKAGSAFSASSDVRSRDARGAWSWAFNPTAHTITATGTVDDTVESFTRPLRGRYVGSKRTNPSGGFIYGIPANGYGAGNATGQNARVGGAWSSVLAVSGNSTIKGSFQTRAVDGKRPDVAMLGAGTLTVASGSTGAYNATLYSDSATISGVTPANSTRSSMTAAYDYNLLNDRRDEIVAGFCDAKNITGFLTGSAYACNYGNFSLPNSPFGTSAGGVKTLVVRGNLTIPYDLTYSGTAQIHIYVTGDVTISQGVLASATRTLSNVFVYAPNGTCKTNSGVNVALTGSMACNKLDFQGTANTFKHALPYEDANYTGRAGNYVYFAESTGYVDSLSN